MWNVKNLQKRPRIYKLTVKIKKEVYKSVFNPHSYSLPDYTEELKTIYAWGLKSFDKKSGGILTYSFDDSRIFYRDTEIVELKRLSGTFPIEGTRVIISPSQNGFTSQYQR